jgi:FAD/FMN-containing dehydrogenase
VRPRDTAQVSAVMRLCHARRQPVVPHGGLTGLVFGTAASPNELILSLEALNRIESVDTAGRTTSCSSRSISAAAAAPRSAATFQPTPAAFASCATE